MEDLKVEKELDKPEDVEEPVEELEPVPEYKKDWDKWLYCIDDMLDFCLWFDEGFWMKKLNDDEWKKQFDDCHSDEHIKELTLKLLEELFPEHFEKLKEQLKYLEQEQKENKIKPYHVM
tara:strand:+ start:2212 stop:2568 length:357 start_codon:yes stop_codon:yes gene_type:complete